MSESSGGVYRTFTGTVVAFLGKLQERGVYVLRTDGGWLYHANGSVAWDAFHQEVFRNGRAEELGPADLERDGISSPPPEPPAGARVAVRWEDNFSSQAAWKDVPKQVLARLRRSGGRPQAVYVLLFEDLYSSSFGDGRALDPVAAFWDRAPAEQDLARRCDGETDPAKRARHGYSLKEVQLRLDPARRRVVADLHLALFEHVSIEKVLGLLERRRKDRPPRP